MWLYPVQSARIVMTQMARIHKQMTKETICEMDLPKYHVTSRLFRKDLRYLLNFLARKIPENDKKLWDIVFSTIVYVSLNSETHETMFSIIDPIKMALEKMRKFAKEKNDEYGAIQALRLLSQVLKKWGGKRKNEYFERKGYVGLFQRLLWAANTTLLYPKIICLGFSCLFHIIDVESLRNVCARKGIIARCYNLLVTS